MLADQPVDLVRETQVLATESNYVSATVVGADRHFLPDEPAHSDGSVTQS